MIGTMRLGGMTPADITQTLPAAYKIIRKLIGANHITIFTEPCKSDDGDLLWMEPDSIIINEHEHQLLYAPSYRTNWCTFTILSEDDQSSV